MLLNSMQQHLWASSLCIIVIQVMGNTKKATKLNCEDTRNAPEKLSGIMKEH